MTTNCAGVAETIPEKLARYEALEAALRAFIEAEYLPEERDAADAETHALCRVQATVEMLRSGADRRALEIVAEGERGLVPQE
ncbi:MAG: hypothetical protein O9284_09885 [Steroidobacteraceae bacterium]|nr:hypothetical protein [Steroidobacteraceae bacterium]